MYIGELPKERFPIGIAGAEMLLRKESDTPTGKTGLRRGRFLGRVIFSDGRFAVVCGAKPNSGGREGLPSSVSPEWTGKGSMVALECVGRRPSTGCGDERLRLVLLGQ